MGETLKKSNRFFYALVGLLVIIFTTLQAQNPTQQKPNPQTTKINSPNCSEDKIKELAKEALLALKTNPDEPNLYEITLNTTQLNFVDLTQMMQKAGCF